MPLEPVTSVNDAIERAREAEASEEPERAATLYEQIIKDDPVNEHAYDRLMVLYRKLKQFKEELRIINTGIKAFEKLYKARAKHSRSRKVAELSNALLKVTGLADKKGNHLYEPEPIGKWKKRKDIVVKKLKK